MRLTPDGKTFAILAIRNALRHAVDNGGEWVSLLGGHAAEIVAKAIDDYPTDRSCFTCDYETVGRCANNDREPIPTPFMEDGCQDWKEEGMPF